VTEGVLFPFRLFLIFYIFSFTPENPTAVTAIPTNANITETSPVFGATGIVGNLSMFVSLKLDYLLLIFNREISNRFPQFFEFAY